MSDQTKPLALVPVTKLTFSDVFSYPQYTLRGIETWEQVASLGSKNITALIARARDHEKEFADNISRTKAKLSLLRGKSGADFVEMAKQHENPTITKIGVRKDSWIREPEPLDVASQNRAHDATTFNMCGWCKHTGGGSCRYNYHISTSCNLLHDSPKTKFNTPCLLHAKTAEEIAAEVEWLEHEVTDLLARRERVREGIRLLQQLKKGTPDKPYLISLRPHDQFNVGDEVMVYVGQWGSKESEYKSLVQDGVWVPAIVVFGYRHHDGCISYQALFPIHSNMSYYEGRGGGSGMSRPEVLMRSEFNYLQEAMQNTSGGDLGFVGLWLTNVDDDLQGFNKERFMMDLLSGTMATPPVDWVPPTDEIEVKTKKDAERVLQCLDSDLFQSEQEIKSWANMQLRHVHPDRLNGASDNVKSYASRQTKAVYAARDLLIRRFRGKKSK